MSKMHQSINLIDIAPVMKNFNGDPAAYQVLFEAIGQQVHFSQVMLVSTFPRSGTQLVQPSQVPDSFSRAYSKGLYTTDAPSWQALLTNKPITGDDCVPTGTLESSDFYQQLMRPNGFAHVMAVRLPAPVLSGYPGVLHLYRRAGEPPFNAEDVHNLAGLIDQIAPVIDAAREARVMNTCGTQPSWEHTNISRQFIFDQEGRQILLDKKAGLDEQLRASVKELVASRIQAVNGVAVTSDRVELADSHGEMWAFRTVVHRTFSALGSGPFVFLCIQPRACEWNAVRPGDFEADAEVSRLVPSLQFMQAEFHRMPTLDEIASKAHLSPFHFHRRFTELLGQTPKHFLLSCQITQAKRMLMERKVPLSEIAAECGFAHQSHFTSRFKQTTGLTPTRWRRYATDHLTSAGGARTN